MTSRSSLQNVAHFQFSFLSKQDYWTLVTKSGVILDLYNKLLQLHSQT